MINRIAAIFGVAAAPLWAHHSFAAEYDASRLLVLNGTVTKIDWTNPHVYLHLKVKGVGANTSEWYLEMASPNSLRRQGWMPDTVKPGDVVTVEAYAAKDYPTGGKIHRVKVPDGRWLFADSGGPSGPATQGYSQK
jgi:hypothetical protein